MSEYGRWQPMMVIIRNGKRLECACGALATIVVGESGEQYNQLEDVDVWCQDCFEKQQEKGDK